MFARAGEPNVLVRLGGLRLDLPVSELRLTGAASDGAVLSALANYLDMDTRALSKAKVDRGLAGHVLVRWKGPHTRSIERRHHAYV